MDEAHLSQANYTPLMVDRKQEAYRVASALYKQAPDWVRFFREILGVGGVVRQLFPDDQVLLEFEKSEEHAEIQSMLARLRQQNNGEQAREPLRVITVRLPQSLHEALQAQAHLHQTSMNKLCISKLLQVIDDEFTGQPRNRLEETHVVASQPSLVPRDPEH
ncbi:MAG: toxin-antitoxin system HicB family antitoxin [Planctomycetota bacterium]